MMTSIHPFSHPTCPETPTWRWRHGTAPGRVHPPPRNTRDADVEEGRGEGRGGEYRRASASASQKPRPWLDLCQLARLTLRKPQATALGVELGRVGGRERELFCVFHPVFPRPNPQRRTAFLPHKVLKLCFQAQRKSPAVQPTSQLLNKSLTLMPRGAVAVLVLVRRSI